MKSKVTKVMIIEQDYKRISLRPNKIVENIEQYRSEIKEQFNARLVLFNLEEITAEEIKTN